MSDCEQDRCEQVRQVQLLTCHHMSRHVAMSHRSITIDDVALRRDCNVVVFPVVVVVY